MGSDASSATLGHVRCRRKTTEVQIFEKHSTMDTKMSKSTVKMLSGTTFSHNHLSYTIRSSFVVESWVVP